MNSLILSTATQVLMGLMLLFSLFILLRGHNEPGGGFVGGLVAAAAFVLYTLAEDVQKTRRVLRIDPRNLIGIGLLTAAASGTISLFLRLPFLTGLWGEKIAPALAAFGTPLLFDVGVYLVVMGVTLTIVFGLAEE